jgi:glutamine---fructose-6-phosphate transaminase (isomerizing)
MPNGEFTRQGIQAQPAWLAQVPTDRRFPDARVLLTGCGTSFHAAQTGGEAVQALELVLAPRRDAELLVLLSHEGETPLTLEAARAFPGPKWCVTAVAESPIAQLCEEVFVSTPEVEKSYCHTASYTCAVAALAALRGEDVAWLSGAVAAAIADPFPVSEHERWLVAGAGRDWPTAQEAVLKLREGVHVAAEAHRTEELLHGHLAALDSSVRAFVLEGEGPAAARSAEAVRALELVGCDVTLVPTSHPVVDIVPFQLLTVDLAADRGLDPDLIRWDEEPWNEARKSYK